MRHEWTDRSGDIGSLFTDGSNICLRLSEDPNEDEDGDVDPVIVLHCLPPAQARALHEALGRALEKVDPKPTTDSISATIAACSAPVPDILRKIDAACGESHLVNVVHGPDGTRVYRTPGTLRSISTEELAKLGLKPKAHLPSDGHLLECGHWSIHKQWCTECAADIVAISQKPSQPEPPDHYGDACYHCENETFDGTKCEKCGRVHVVKAMASQPEPPPTGNGASALHPRPFFWDWTGGGFVKVDGSNNRVGIRTTEDLLTRIPNALEAHESSYSQQTDCPSFGFDTEHDRPRTLREYLEAP